MRRSWVACIAIAGCSWTFTDKLPDSYEPHSTVQPRCDTGRGPMVADLVFAAISVISSTVELSDSRQNVKDAGFADLGFALLYALSAASGASWTSHCRQAIEEYDASAPSAPEDSAEAKELRQLRAEKAARDAAELERLRTEHNVITDAGVVVDAPSDGSEP